MNDIWLLFLPKSFGWCSKKQFLFPLDLGFDLCKMISVSGWYKENYELVSISSISSYSCHNFFLGNGDLFSSCLLNKTYILVFLYFHDGIILCINFIKILLKSLDININNIFGVQEIFLNYWTIFIRMKNLKNHFTQLVLELKVIYRKILGNHCKG